MGKINEQHDIFCWKVALRTRKPALRSRWPVIGRSRITEFSARLLWPDNHKNLKSVRVHLSGGGALLYSDRSQTCTPKIYIHKNYLTWHGNLCRSLGVYIANKLASEVLRTRIRHCYIIHCSVVWRIEADRNLKMKGFRCVFLWWKWSFLDNLEMLLFF